MDSGFIVVCGATGQQGGAVVKALLERKRAVRALVRDPGAPAARALDGGGVPLVQGNLDDLATLTAAFTGASAVFGVTQPWARGARHADAAREVVQGRNLIDAAKAVDVPLVMSTQMHATDKPTGIPHADSKLAVEAYARQQGIRWVNLRPGSFLDNIGVEWFPVTKGKIQGLTAATAKVPYIATRDIGRAAAAIADELPKYLGRHVNLITGLYSGSEICEALSRVRNGERFRWATHPRFVMRLFFREFFLIREAFEKQGSPPFPAMYEDGLASARSLISDPWSLEEFLRQKGFATRQLK